MKNENIRQISYIVITALFALIGYSFSGIIDAKNNLDKTQFIIQKFSIENSILRKEMSSVPGFNKIIEDSMERPKMTNKLNVKKDANISEKEVYEWRLKILNNQIKIKTDQGKLAQYNIKDYPNIYNMASSLKNLLSSENMIINDLKMYIEKQASKSIDIEIKEKYFQKYLNSNLEHAKIISELHGILNNTIFHISILKENTSLEMNKVLHDLNSYMNTILLYSFIFIISLLICAVIILNLFEVKFSKKTNDI